jgi:hypothetical protein
MKRAFCVGINDYPGISNDLKGCVNDATDWASLLEYSGFEVEKLINEQATRQNILSKLDNLVTNATAGDEIVFTYSGHGTSIYDVGGDEPDEYDEALYVYDGLLVDDELRAIFQKVKPDVHVVVISDSCFSGTVTRALITDSSKPRYIKTHDIPTTAKLKKRLLEEEEMIEILLSGCSNTEYSYDAYLNGRWNGALTSYATSVIRKGQTYKEFYQQVRELLPSGQYPQTPQLEGSEANKNRVVFAANTDPLPKPDPEPENSVWDWLKKYWWVILIVIAAGVVLWSILK